MAALLAVTKAGEMVVMSVESSVEMMVVYLAALMADY